MVKLYDYPVCLTGDTLTAATSALPTPEDGKQRTMAYSILTAHDQGKGDGNLQIKFDELASHDITYVGIVQTARASGLEKFPIPYVLTNCHNSLCAVGGTINEDDHLFGLSAAKKYGGIYVPAHQAVIHQYMREMHAGCGKMILGSDSHTRYGALGTMAIGEGGPELVKQLLCKTYDIQNPDVIAVHISGAPQPGVGPQDVALAIIGAVFENGFVKNKVMEFIGPGIAALSAEYRCGIDVMTTETTCLSSIWQTDSVIEEYFAIHGRPQAYKPLAPQEGAYYSGAIVVDLSKIKPMIALPFHPSNTYCIEEFLHAPGDILRELEKKAAAQLDAPGVQFNLTDKLRGGKFYVDQGVIAGCAGGSFENIMAAADILDGQSIGCDEFALSVYPASQPIFMELVKNGAIAQLMGAGATVRTAFCGPCFGAGDVPANGALSIRHSTRNFPAREGSKPTGGQIASVALMDARSIAASAKNGGMLTSATTCAVPTKVSYYFDKTVYDNRVYTAPLTPDGTTALRLGPNIADWPAMQPLGRHLLVEIAAHITDDVTTTDELIPSGETSSYRSNPLKLAEFTLSRKAPGYVNTAKEIAAAAWKQGHTTLTPALEKAVQVLKAQGYFANPADNDQVQIGSAIYARKPGDGSAREQAASCQKVLGGLANIAREYATKRYRSNLINWGMLPFLCKDEAALTQGACLFVPELRAGVEAAAATIPALAIAPDGSVTKLTLQLGNLTSDERAIILAGCLINFYRG